MQLALEVPQRLSPTIRYLLGTPLSSRGYAPKALLALLLNGFAECCLFSTAISPNWLLKFSGGLVALAIGRE